MGIMTGSKSVITLNLNRIIQNIHRSGKISNDFENWTDSDFEGLKSEFKTILERVYKYHTAYNELLKDMYSANLLPAYKAGFINLNKQYLTIGLNGLNEAAEFLGITLSDNPNYSQFCSELFSFIKECNQEHKTKELSFNTECVPAESLAIKNYNWDKADGYVVPFDRNLYASYIYLPSDSSVSILEKIRMHGSRFIGEYLDGGSAAHINLSEHPDVIQCRMILEYAAKEGCQYFTFNVPNSECQECGHITKHPISKCPHCGSEKISYYDRIIGYLTKIDNWSDGRQEEQKTRVYHTMGN
jgi:ribonucleoside-triphosphate reductase